MWDIVGGIFIGGVFLALFLVGMYIFYNVLISPKTEQMFRNLSVAVVFITIAGTYGYGRSEVSNLKQEVQDVRYENSALMTEKEKLEEDKKNLLVQLEEGGKMDGSHEAKKDGFNEIITVPETDKGQLEEQRGVLEKEITYTEEKAENLLNEISERAMIAQAKVKELRANISQAPVQEQVDNIDYEKKYELAKRRLKGEDVSQEEIQGRAEVSQRS